MAETDVKPTIVVKRIKKVAGGHHGGAWKIAYADFMTAMMAFFLLMWLLGSTTQGDLQGIAEYFQTPLRVALAGGSGAGASNSILSGGGKNLTQESGQVQKSEPKSPDEAPRRKKMRLSNIDKAMRQLKDMKALKELKQKIEAAITANPNLNKYKSQLMLDIVSDGLRIQIVDEKNRPMFAVSKAELEPYAKTILREIGHMLNDVPNKISLSGHTDALPFTNGEKSYSNWELSSDRANASRRELVQGGMQESKLLQVVGQSSAVLFDKKDPLNPINRRIAILVLNKDAENRILNDDQMVKINSAEDSEPLLEQSNPVGQPTDRNVTKLPAKQPAEQTNPKPATQTPGAAAPAIPSVEQLLIAPSEQRDPAAEVKPESVTPEAVKSEGASPITDQQNQETSAGNLPTKSQDAQ
jgi:chemotaxis protein MotB